MRTPSIMAILICCGSTACLAQANDPAVPAAKPDVGSQASTDLRPRTAGMQLKKGINTLYTNRAGWTLQAVVDRHGTITGYLQLDAAGKTSKIQTQTPQSPALMPGQMALVHKCFIITIECQNNPLPRSGNPEDCSVDIECPKKGSFSDLLSR